MMYAPRQARTILVGGMARAGKTAGGFAQYAHFGDTAAFDGERWTTWDAPLSDALAQKAGTLFCDPITGHVVLLRHCKLEPSIVMSRYEGRGAWVDEARVALAPPSADSMVVLNALSTAFAFERAGRRLFALRPSQGAAAPALLVLDLAPWLDALPPVEWST